MRKLVLLLAILALPGLAMAQPTMDASSPADLDLDGIINYDPNIDTQIVVDVALGPATTVNGACQYSLSIDGMANDADWDLGNVAQTNGLFFMGGAMTDTAGGTMPAGYLVGQSMAIVNATVAEGYMAMGAYGPGAPMATWTITGNNAVLSTKVGTSQLIQADFPVWPSNNVDGAPLAGAGVALLVNIVPEPATALLLLGAIPFLRRRR